MPVPRRTFGSAPPERGHRTPPAGRDAAQVRVPKGAPDAGTPKLRAVGKPPNPRKVKLVRDVTGGALGDLFAMFPDLPRPVRPAPRLRARKERR